MTIRAAVFAFLDQQNKPINFGVAFLVWVICKYNKNNNAQRKHAMKCVRDYVEISGALIKYNRRDGYYRFTPGVKVGQAIVD